MLHYTPTRCHTQTNTLDRYSSHLAVSMGLSRNFMCEEMVPNWNNFLNLGD